MTRTIAAIIWVAGIVLWFATRYPHQRRARKIAVVSQGRDLGDRLFPAGAGVGLALFPLVYVLTGFPAFADYAFRPWMSWAGAIVESLFIWLFFESHRALGRTGR